VISRYLSPFSFRGTWWKTSGDHALRESSNPSGRTNGSELHSFWTAVGPVLVSAHFLLPPESCGTDSGTKLALWCFTYVLRLALGPPCDVPKPNGANQPKHEEDRGDEHRPAGAIGESAGQRLDRGRRLVPERTG